MSLFSLHFSIRKLDEILANKILFCHSFLPALTLFAYFIQQVTIGSHFMILYLGCRDRVIQLLGTLYLCFFYPPYLHRAHRALNLSNKENMLYSIYLHGNGPVRCIISNYRIWYFMISHPKQLFGISEQLSLRLTPLFKDMLNMFTDIRFTGLVQYTHCACASHKMSSSNLTSILVCPPIDVFIITLFSPIFQSFLLQDFSYLSHIVIIVFPRSVSLYFCLG